MEKQTIVTNKSNEGVIGELKSHYYELPWQLDINRVILSNLTTLLIKVYLQEPEMKKKVSCIARYCPQVNYAPAT